MTKDTDKILKGLQITESRNRKMAVRNILVAILVFIIFTLVAYFYTLVFIITVLIDFFALLVLLASISTWYKPLEPEQYAFRKIMEAIDSLDASSEQASEEAYSNIKGAYKILNKRPLNKTIGWYERANMTFERLVKNLQLIVLPAVNDSEIKKEHLKEIALAINSMNLGKVREVNEMLESNYDKTEPEPSAVKTLLTMARESTIGRILVSLIAGYSLILVICFFYALGTNQDFVTFLKDQPSIVILGGLGVSGVSVVTLWRIK